MLTFPIDGLSNDELVSVNNLHELLLAKRRRNRLRAAYYDGRNAINDLGISIPPQLRELAVVLGWPSKAVDILNRRCQLQGFALPGGETGDFGIDQAWADNRLEVEAPQIGASSLVHSVSFLITTAGDVDAGEPEVLILAKDALSGAAAWDPRRRRISEFLSIVDEDDTVGVRTMVLYRPGVTITLRRGSNGRWVPERRPTGLDRVLVEPVVYRPRLGRPFGASRISRAVMSLTDSALRTVLRSEVSAEFYSSPQRYLLGADESAFQDAAGNVKTQWQAILGRVWAIDRDDDGQLPSVGQFPQSSQQPHVDQLRAWAQLFAGETGIPLASLGISADANPVSADAYRASRDDLFTEARGTMRDWTPAWTQTMRNVVLVREGAVPPELNRLSADWSQVEVVNPAAADAVTKLVSQFPWMANSNVALEMLGLDAERTERLIADRRRLEGRTALQQALAAAAQPSVTDGNVGG